eukprot:gene18070-24597_t
MKVMDAYIDGLNRHDEPAVNAACNFPHVRLAGGKVVKVDRVEIIEMPDPQQQVKEAVGSGPYMFAKDQWVPGSKAVYLKNKDYQPRTEPP